jgi:surface antigen
MPKNAPAKGIVGAALVAATILVAPAAAPAMPPPCDRVDNPCPTGPKHARGTVSVANGFSLTVRRRPNPNAKKVRKLPNGHGVIIACQLQGAQVTGTFGTSRLWDKLIHGGYVSDTYINTGSDGRVAPSCPPIGRPHPHHGHHPQQHHHGTPADVTLRNDYPYQSASPESVDPWGFYDRECTSFVAYRLNQLQGFNFSNRMQGGHFGDGGNWDDNARSLGFKVNHRPTVGSVMVRDSGTWGHVAIVAKVSKQRFLVEEYNHDVDHGYGQRWISRAPNGDWDHFIHFR